MSTNQERRAEARQRLREQMEAQARREKQLKIVAASVVVAVLLGIVGVVAWINYDRKRAEEYAANWLTCEYPADTETPEPLDPAEFEDQGDEVVAEVEEFNAQVETVNENRRDAEPPSGDQARRGIAELTITTDRGEIPLTLDRSDAPCNVASFVHLAEQRYFDDTECHRLTVAEETTGPEEVPGLSVLQCGDPTGTGLSGPGYSVVDEPPAPDTLELAADGSGAAIYPRGTVAMAKSQAPDSAGSQFFLVYEDSALPPEYTVMGTVGEPGLEVLDDIAETGVKSDDPTDRDNQVPRRPVTIETVVVDEQSGLPDR
ncbi:peptidylprolyl isomerase [Dietzia sp. UCD-THP]|uniref:Peptidylprolyl isomerase n=1 Tax=Dietzia natronolimnaea TaxID=161920 RepID=A0A2A2WU59_9ACTN|nr:MULTISPECIES: peptidylprolyl isomerase [Dietzia]EYT63649.1 peptidylprolyl isomerase [Dietzia sp. UCD-THP]PAY24759.1 peptidylprolyl isomerase [Dietzia natronolimnaea]